MNIQLKLGDYAVLKTLIFLQMIHQRKDIQVDVIARALKTSTETIEQHLETLESKKVIQRENNQIQILEKEPDLIN